jgi:hypothetical protein
MKITSVGTLLLNDIASHAPRLHRATSLPANRNGVGAAMTVSAARHHHARSSRSEPLAASAPSRKTPASSTAL